MNQIIDQIGTVIKVYDMNQELKDKSLIEKTITGEYLTKIERVKVTNLLKNYEIFRSTSNKDFLLLIQQESQTLSPTLMPKKEEE